MRALAVIVLLICAGMVALTAGNTWGMVDDRPAETRGPGFGMLVPPPATLDEFLSRKDVVVIGSIIAVVDERGEGPYSSSAPLPADVEDSNPHATPTPSPGLFTFTYYSVAIERVLRDGQNYLASDGSLLLRISGSAERDIAFSNMMPMPRPGDRFLFALSLNPDGQSYGTGRNGLIHIDGESPEFGDWERTRVSFATDLSPEEFVEVLATD